MKIKHYVFLLAFSVSHMLVQSYELNKCYCWNDMNSTLRNELVNITVPSTLGQYEYVGVVPRTGNAYDGCTCTDVTRVKTPLEIKESWAYIDSSNQTKINAAIGNITRALEEALETKKRTGDMRSVTVKYNALGAQYTSIWDIEVVMKGGKRSPSDATSKIKMKTDNGNGTYTLKDIGSININSVAFTVVQCAGEPPSPPADGVRTWDGSKVPTSRANYSCNTGFFISHKEKAFSKCDHYTLAWTALDSSVTCSKGCQDNPPDRPLLMMNTWTLSMRNEGDEVLYFCRSGYRSATGVNETSKCTSGKWTPLKFDSKTNRCERILCSKNIPQVPAYGKTDWDKNKTYIGTNITYTCIQGYTSTVKDTVRVTCDGTGQWTPLPSHFECANNDFARRMGFYDEQQIDGYQYYEDSVNPREISYSDNWFWMVTIPSIIALGVLIFCCLCCTRTNSPIFYLCTANTRNTDYVWG